MNIFMVNDSLRLLGQYSTTYKAFNNYSSAKKYVLERVEGYKKYKYFFNKEGNTKPYIKHFWAEQNAVTASSNAIVYSVDIYEEEAYDFNSISIEIIKLEVE